MKLKVLSFSAIFALAATPMASHAELGSGAAFDACVKSFVETYLPGHPVRKVMKSSPAPSAFNLLIHRNEYTILLSARGMQSGDVIAEARCVANRNGIVIVLDEPSLAAMQLIRPDFVVSMR